MKNLIILKTLNFKLVLAAAALTLAAPVGATASQGAAPEPLAPPSDASRQYARPHFITFDWLVGENRACSSSIFEVAAKYANCMLKAEAKAARRGVAADLATCDAKVARWTKRPEKACCSDYAYDPVAHEACVDAVDSAVIDAGTGSCDGGDLEDGIPDEGGSIQGQKWHDLNQDGIRGGNEPFLDGWTIELLSSAGAVIATTTTASIDLNNNQTIEPDEVGVYQFDVAPGSYRVREVQQPGWIETTQVNPADVAAYNLDQDVDLSGGPSLFEDWGGLGEKWLQDVHGNWHFVLPNGDVFRWNSSSPMALSGTQVASTSSAHHANPALLYDATNPYEQRVSVNPDQTVTSINFANYQEPVPPPQ